MKREPLARIGDLVDAASAVGGPFSIAIIADGGALATLAGGAWPSGKPACPDDRFYGASLAKQITGAAIALLVNDGRLDPTAPVTTMLPDVGGWGSRVNALQLFHHVAGLPDQGKLEADVREGSWTNKYVLSQLQRFTRPLAEPGTGYDYSNAGYVVLARIIEAVTGLDFPEFVASQLSTPLGLETLGFSSTAGQPPSEQWSLLGPSLPLTTGDGGLWTTAGDFARWLDIQNEDRLGIADRVCRLGQLADGQEVDYGWGIGLRGQPRGDVIVHGGGWTGAAAKAIRCPRTALSLVVLGAGSAAPKTIALADAIFGRLQPDRVGAAAQMP